MKTNIYRPTTLFSSMQWLTMIGGLLVACMSVTAFAFTTFVLKTDFESVIMRFEKRLERIENKLDADLSAHRR